MTKEKLNLFQFASGVRAEAGAGATKIVGCQMVNADSFGVSLHGIPVLTDDDRMAERLQSMAGTIQCLLSVRVYAHLKLDLPIETQIHDAYAIGLNLRP
jgi:hypothetical protein